MTKGEDDGEQVALAEPVPEKEPVGYGHPPKRSRFKGGRSANPRGRPKGARGFAKMLREVAFETHTVMENGEARRRTNLDLILLTVRAHATKGTPRGSRAYDAYQELFGPQDPIQPTGFLIVPERLTAEEFDRELKEARDNWPEQLARLQAEHEVRLAKWKAESGR